MVAGFTLPLVATILSLNHHPTPPLFHAFPKYKICAQILVSGSASVLICLSLH